MEYACSYYIYWFFSSYCKIFPEVTHMHSTSEFVSVGYSVNSFKHLLLLYATVKSSFQSLCFFLCSLMHHLFKIYSPDIFNSLLTWKGFIPVFNNSSLPEIFFTAVFVEVVKKMYREIENDSTNILISGLFLFFTLSCLFLQSQ